MRDTQGEREFDQWWNSISIEGQLADDLEHFTIREQAAIVKFCKAAFEAASAPAVAGEPSGWKKAVLDLSWIPLHIRHDIIRNLETHFTAQPAAMERQWREKLFAEWHWDIPQSPEEWDKSYGPDANPALKNSELCAWNWMCRAQKAEAALAAFQRSTKDVPCPENERSATTAEESGIRSAGNLMKRLRESARLMSSRFISGYQHDKNQHDCVACYEAAKEVREALAALPPSEPDTRCNFYFGGFDGGNRCHLDKGHEGGHYWKRSEGQ